MEKLKLEDFNSLFYILAFIVPGFITNSTLAAFIPQKSEGETSSILRFLSLSCLNYALWSWLIFWLFQTDRVTEAWQKAALYAVIVLVAPIINGIVLVGLSNAQIVRRLLGRLGFNPINEIPTGWDYKFSKMKNGEWLLVTLKDGKKISGFFGSNSFASSGDQRDIFIEKVWNCQENGKWLKVDRTAGVLVFGDSINHIEFFSDEVSDDVGQETAN